MKAITIFFPIKLQTHNFLTLLYKNRY